MGKEKDNISMPNLSKDRCVLFYVKYPEKGEVKTRLSSYLDETITVELYRNFILDLLSKLEKLPVEFCICFYPQNAKEKFVEWLGKRYFYIPQEGEDLGQRMKNSFLQAFAAGFRRVILIGSDIPDLPSSLISEAFSFLKTHDAVIGPTLDGGYYLVGFNKGSFLPKVFDGMKWSTSKVYEDTLSFFKKGKHKIHILPKWQDVDTINDLKELFKKNKDTEFGKSKTICYLLKYKDMFK